MCDRPPALVHDRPRRARRGRRRRRRGRLEGQHRHRDVRRRLSARLARGRARRAVEPGLGGAVRVARHPFPADRQAGGRPHGRGGARGSRRFAGERPRQRLRRRDREVARRLGRSSRCSTPSARAALHVPATGSSIRSGSRSATPSWQPETASRCSSARRSPAFGQRGERLTHRRDAQRAARRPVRRERRRDRGRHDLAARRRRAVLDLAAAGPVLAARPRGRREIPGDRGRRPDRREPRRLLRADDARVAAPRADGARRDRPERPGHDAATLDVMFAAARRLVPELDRRWAIKTFAANRPASEPGYRIGIDRNRAEPGARRRHPLDRRVVVAGARRAGARDPRRGRSAGAGRAPGAATALEPVPRLFGHPDPAALFARDPAYGEVVCPCEQVTAAEIAAALRMRVPPRSVDGLRKRTHATAGRCQGAMCLGRIRPSAAAGWRRRRDRRRRGERAGVRRGARRPSPHASSSSAARAPAATCKRRRSAGTGAMLLAMGPAGRSRSRRTRSSSPRGPGRSGGPSSGSPGRGPTA